MTLKKYNVIVYFIILLNLVVYGIIAQDAEPSTETSIPSGEKAEKNVTAESCLKETACINTNETIRLCNGRFRAPNTYIEEGTRSGIYEPEDRGLARCMCNQEYYDNLSKCLECFNSAERTEFKVPPLEEYQNKCKKVGTTFTETKPQVIPSTIPPKVKWGVIGGVAVLVLILVGIAVFKFYKKKKVSAEGSGTKKPSSSYQYTPQTSEYYPPPPSGQSSQYPPPQSGHYPPPQSGQYSSPQSGHYPPPQGGEYPPPPQGSQYPPPQSSQYPPPSGGQGDRVGQSGQSDSYYGGNY